jgi:crotonobetainyl-CoA:carnitine CoA-transferase CaiB-like acyl-CoA transferase
LRDRAGHDINYLALSGLMSHSGRRDEGPALMGVQIADIGGGSFGALVGVLAAVIERQVSGRGQSVDISMLDMMLAWQSHIYSEYFAGQERVGREDALLNGGGPYDFYQTADGRYLAVGSLEPKFWRAFCAVLGRPDLAPLGFDRDAQGAEGLKAEIRRLIAARPLNEWIERFEREDACVEAVLTTGEAINQAQTRARDMVVEVPKAEGGSQRQIGSPFRFSGSAASYKFAGVRLGAHSTEVLAEIGYAAHEIEELRLKGLLG